jgi:aspartate racemase
MSTTKSNGRKVIGVVGGVGPYAGLDLNQKIFASTRIAKEQDHLDVFLLSCASQIEDRTEYLLHPDSVENPGHAILAIVERLSRIGAEVVGIPCNTSHSPAILDIVERGIAEARLPLRFVHLIRETSRFIRSAHPGISRVGLLATNGTCRSGVYTQVLRESGIDVLTPPPERQQAVHAAIYDPAYGIKVHPNPIRKEAVAALSEAGAELVKAGAQAVIMGCTEIPLALRPVNLGVPKIDTTLVLARALIEYAAPDALLPLP